MVEFNDEMSPKREKMSFLQFCLAFRTAIHVSRQYVIVGESKEIPTFRATVVVGELVFDFFPLLIVAADVLPCLTGEENGKDEDQAIQDVESATSSS